MGRENRLRMRLLALLLAFLQATDAEAVHAPAPRPRLTRRTLRIDDASARSIPELRVGALLPTLLTVDAPLADEGVLLVDVEHAFYPPRQTPHSVVLVPRRALASHERFALTVLLGDGTALPFELRAAGDEVDVQVDLQIALRAGRGTESLEAVREQLQAARDELEACQGDSALQAVRAIASKLAAAAPSGGEALAVLHREEHFRDRQEGIWMEVRHAYRLFDVTYFLVELRNRSSTPFVFAKAQFRGHGTSTSTDGPVRAAAAEPASVPPDERGSLVVAVKSPEAGTIDLEVSDITGRTLHLGDLQP